MPRLKRTIISVIVLASASAAQAQFGLSNDQPSGDDLVDARLIVQHDPVAAGATEHVAVVFEIEDGWHLYWQNSGDTGAAPKVDLRLPEGVRRSGPMRWPTPERYVHGGGMLLDYVHEDRLTLVVPVEVDASLAGREIRLGAEVEWLVCKEICLAGSASLERTVRVAAPGEQPARAEGAELIDEASRAWPAEGLPEGVEARWEGLTLVLAAPKGRGLTLYPVAPAVGGPSSPIEQCRTDGDTLRVGFPAKLREAGRVDAVLSIDSGPHAGRYRFTMPAPGADRSSG